MPKTAPKQLQNSSKTQKYITCKESIEKYIKGGLKDYVRSTDEPEYMPLSLKGVERLITLYSMSFKKDTSIGIEVKEVKDHKELDGSIKEKSTSDLSFKIILEKSEPKYHFIMLVKCCDCTYIFDPIGIEGNDWGKKIKKSIEDNEEGYSKVFVNTIGLQKDLDTCGDYVVEFFRILINLYDNCKRDIKLFNDHLSSFFDKETRTEKKIGDLYILPKEFLELSQSTGFLRKYLGFNEKVDKELGNVYQESFELEEKLMKLNEKLIKLENNLKIGSRVIEQLNNNRVSLESKILILIKTNKIKKEEYSNKKNDEKYINDKYAKLSGKEIAEIKKMLQKQCEELESKKEEKEKTKKELESKKEEKEKTKKELEYICITMMNLSNIEEIIKKREAIPVEEIIGGKEIRPVDVTKILEKRLEHFEKLNSEFEPSGKVKHPQRSK